MSVRELAARTPAPPVFKAKTLEDLRAELQRWALEVTTANNLLADWSEHRHKITTVSYDVTDETVILANAGGITITLPASDNDNINRDVHVKNLAGTAISVDPRGTDTIDGTAASYPITNQYESRHFVADGVGGWHILALMNPAAANGSGAPSNASFLTLGLDATLTNERVLTAGTGITFVDTGANGTLTISISSGFFAGFAAPTAQVGLTAIAGVATTAIRSDGAPRLDVTISPTGVESWSGTHNWAPSANTTPVTITKTAGLSSANIALVTNTAATEHYLRASNVGAFGFGFLSSFSDPTAIVHAVADGANTVSNAMQFDAYGSSINCALLQRRALGSRSAPRRISGVNFTLGGIFTFGATAVDDVTNSTFPASTIGSLEFFSREAFTTTAQGTAFQIHTTLTGTTTRIPRLTISEFGNVGIGLNIAGAAYGAFASAKLEVLSTVNAQLRATHTSGSIYGEIRTQSTGVVQFTATGGATPVFRFDQSVGIGVVPVTPLHVLSTSSPQVRIAYDTSHYATESVASTGATTFAATTDDSANVVQFLFQSSALSSAADNRAIFRINDSSANSAINIWPDRRIELYGATGSTTATGPGALNILATLPFNIGVMFSPAAFTSAGQTITGLATAISGVYFKSAPDGGIGATCTATNVIGAAFECFPAPAALNDRSFYGAVFQPHSVAATSNTGRIWPIVAGFKVAASAFPTKASFGTITNYYGGYLEAAATGSCVNEYGLYIEERTRGTSIKNGIFIAGQTAGWKSLLLGSQNEYITSAAAGTVSMVASSSFIFTVNGTDQATLNDGLWQAKDTFDFQFGTGNGTKFGTATSEKMGWWNATPVVQPDGTNPVHVTLDTLGLRVNASGDTYGIVCVDNEVLCIDDEVVVI